MTKAEFGLLCAKYIDAHKAEAAAKELKDEAKEALLAAPDTMFDLDGMGKPFKFDTDLKAGIRRITVEPKDVIDTETAIAYAKDKELLDCVKVTESLDQDAFLARVKNGDVPKATFKKMVKKSVPPAPYIRFIADDPTKKEGVI